ncbi:MAG: hypothetical protein ACRELV_17000 [Longimicrobiales bacterium]
MARSDDAFERGWGGEAAPEIRKRRAAPPAERVPERLAQGRDASAGPYLPWYERARRARRLAPSDVQVLDG